MEDKYIVYVKTNSAGYIIDIDSSAFLSNSDGWVRIGEGAGDKYHHAQGNYFPKPIVTDGGAWRYKLVDGAPAACTAEEIAQQEAANQPESGASEDAVWDALAAAYNEGVQSA